MSDGCLSPKTITGNYVPVVKMGVGCAVDEQGEQIYPRKWNHDFIDLPVPQKDKQNTPSFSAEVMTGLARWKKPRERMIFILCGAAGLRIGEALGIEIDKHLSSDFLTQAASSSRKDRPTAQDCECRPSSRSSPGDCHLPPTVRWRPQGWTPVLHSNREAAFADQYSSAPSACGSEGTKLRESMHWNA